MRFCPHFRILCILIPLFCVFLCFRLHKRSGTPRRLDLADWQKVIYEEAKDHCRPINASRGKLGLVDNPLLLIYRIDKDATKAINETRESIKTKEDIIAYAIIVSGDGKDDVGPSTLSII